MAGPHFFVDATVVDGDTAILSGAEAHHLAVVLRARHGDPVTLADGTGAMFDARVRSADPGAVELVLTGRWEVPAPSPRLTVVHALPRARKLDDVVQRLSEVGVDRLVPVRSGRSQVRLDGERADKAVTRWRAVALAAAKQSRRARPLEVTDLGDWNTALPPGVPGAVLWEEATDGLRGVLRDAGPTTEFVLAVGPEGGLSAEEVATTGLPVASLGPTVLRTETAALVAAAVVLAEVGRIG